MTKISWVDPCEGFKPSQGSTNLGPKLSELRSRGINQAHAADLRARLATFAQEWESPEMDVYDHYDAAKANL
jgi:hypothetical protein